MALIDQIQTEMTAAMKGQDAVKLDTLRMIKTSLQKYKVDNPGKPLDEQMEIQILNTLIKQRKEAADMFRKGGREELAVKEEGEQKLIESYMPAAASDADIDAAVASAIAETPGASIKQMGVVMKAAQAKLTGKRVDGKALSEKVRSKLS